MARRSSIVERKETWGILRYDTLRHCFECAEREPRANKPYLNQPVVLNIVVTLRCNMDCGYCMAKDFLESDDADLVFSQRLVRWINRSPFMLLVFTGGEPLMPPHDSLVRKLVASIKCRGFIVDTNGTFFPSAKLLLEMKKSRAMVRVSMDSVNPGEEIQQRTVPGGSRCAAFSAYATKVNNIERFVASGLFTAVQAVIWRRNLASVYAMIPWLSEIGVKRWYLQRLIPSRNMKTMGTRVALDPKGYYEYAKDIAAKARAAGIQCVSKVESRHNSVFLLRGNGTVYTQGSAPGQKVRLGCLGEIASFFDYVSRTDHSVRYTGDVPMGSDIG